MAETDHLLLRNLPGALYRLRLRARMSQRAAERRTGIGQSNISRYESGDKDPELNTLLILLVGYGATWVHLDAAMRAQERDAQKRRAAASAEPKSLQENRV
jgi:transcriptional regulator with XRE-family HTH domain